MGMFRGANPWHPLHVLKELDDRKAETDQRDRRAQPRHNRTFEGKAGPQPGKVAVCGDPYFKPASMSGCGCICHARYLFAD
jgi:hypothetical protein